MFHNHLFQQSEDNKEIIFCRCGEIKSLHLHKWKEKNTLSRADSNDVVGFVLECSTCGDIKYTMS